MRCDVSISRKSRHCCMLSLSTSLSTYSLDNRTFDAGGLRFKVSPPALPSQALHFAVGVINYSGTGFPGGMSSACDVVGSVGFGRRGSRTPVGGEASPGGATSVVSKTARSAASLRGRAQCGRWRVAVIRSDASGRKALGPRYRFRCSSMVRTVAQPTSRRLSRSLRPHGCCGEASVVGSPWQR